MKAFIKSHRRLCIVSGVILVLLLSVLVWIQIRIGFRNLPLKRISATVEFADPSNASDGLYYIYFKLDDPSVWPYCEYATTHYSIDNFKEGDRICMLCTGKQHDSLPPGLTVVFMWKE